VEQNDHTRPLAAVVPSVHCTMDAAGNEMRAGNKAGPAGSEIRAVLRLSSGKLVRSRALQFGIQEPVEQRVLSELVLATHRPSTIEAPVPRRGG
jgi:hypothetical protein